MNNHESYMSRREEKELHDIAAPYSVTDKLFMERLRGFIGRVASRNRNEGYNSGHTDGCELARFPQ